MIKYRIFIVLFLILTNLSSVVFAGDKQPLVIADKGKSNVSIIIADNASKRVQTAAEDLQKTLKESTGALLPIVKESKWKSGPRILVGMSNAVKALGVKVPFGLGFDTNKQAVILKRIGSDIVLAGNDTGFGTKGAGALNGTQDAVICFLNKIVGASFYMPIADYKVVPKHDKLAITALDISEKPAFAIRPSIRGGGKSTVEYRRWSHAGGVWFDHRHSHFMIAPIKKYVKEHPEYYAEINGKRVAKGKTTWQLCTSNSDVIKLAVSFCRNWLKNHPNSLAAPLSFNDSKTFCTCKECRKFDIPDPLSGPSKRLCTFANAVAREIAKSNPGKGVAFYAYFMTTVPPLDIKLEPNVTVVYCLSEGCCIHGLTNQGCAANRDELQRLKQWKKIAPNLKIYDYYDFLGDYYSFPFCNLQRLVDNIGIFKKLNIVGLYIDLFTIPGRGPYNWATGQLMWNSAESAESLLKRYCDALFGKASEAMNDYYRHMEEACVSSGTHAPVYGWMMPGPQYIWKDNVIKQLNKDLNRAESLVPANSIETRRINDQKLYIKYTETFVQLKQVQRVYWKNETQANLLAYSTKRSEFVNYLDQLSKRGLVKWIPRTLKAYAPENPHVSWDKPPAISITKLTKKPKTEPLSITNKIWDSSKGFRFWDEDIFMAYPNTSAKFACDDSNLYVKVRCKDFNMSKMKAAAKVRDGNVWDDDSVRLSIALPAKGSESVDVKNVNRFDFLVNVGGTKKDWKNKDLSWNADWDVKLVKEDKINVRSWFVMFVIPWQSLGLNQPPKQLKANVFRHVTTQTVQPVQFLSPTLGALENVKKYAIITLSK